MTEDANLGNFHVLSPLGYNQVARGFILQQAQEEVSDRVLISCYILTKEQENDSTNHNPRNRNHSGYDQIFHARRLLRLCYQSHNTGKYGALSCPLG